MRFLQIFFLRKRQLFRGITVEYLTFSEEIYKESLYFKQRLINLCYCKSFRKNNNLKVYFEKQTKSNLFIITSKHAANASPPNQNKVLELTFIIFSINVAIQTNLCLYRSLLDFQALITVGITHFCLIQNISQRVSPLPRGSLLLVYMYLCSSKSNYNTTREYYEPF